jgi:hypothetical protein
MTNSSTTNDDDNRDMAPLLLTPTQKSEKMPYTSSPPQHNETMLLYQYFLPPPPKHHHHHHGASPSTDYGSSMFSVPPVYANHGMKHYPPFHYNTHAELILPNLPHDSHSYPLLNSGLSRSLLKQPFYSPDGVPQSGMHNLGQHNRQQHHHQHQNQHPPWQVPVNK